MFKNRKKSDNSDSRVKLGNKSAELLWIKHNCTNSKELIEEGRVLFDDMEDSVRNFYELEDDIPLFRLVNLLEYGADNYGYTDEEYQEEIDIALKGCETYYNK